MGWKFWKRESNSMPQDTVPPGAFQLIVEDVFSITGRGTIVTGRVTAGTVTVGDQVLLSRTGQPMMQIQVTGIEMFRKTVHTAGVGGNVGLLLRGVDRAQVGHGDVLSK